MLQNLAQVSKLILVIFYSMRAEARPERSFSWCIFCFCEHLSRRDNMNEKAQNLVFTSSKINLLSIMLLIKNMWPLTIPLFIYIYLLTYPGWPKLAWHVTEHLSKPPKDWQIPPRPADDMAAYIEVRIGW